MGKRELQMANNEIGQLRRSNVASNFGPGAVVDFRTSAGAPVSAVAAGLEEWDRRFKPAGLANQQTIFEPRLQQVLSVKGFRLPPVDPEERKGPQGQPLPPRALAGVRFPTSLQCPQCHRVMTAARWGRDPGQAYRYCQRCTAEAVGGKKVFVVPVRFITACEEGHLDEFPWHVWVRHKDGCTNKERMLLEPEGAGLAGLRLSCPVCRASRTMEGVFARDALKDMGLKCRGRRPWLGRDSQPCDAEVRVLQRGASNLYFPVTASALSIPPWSDTLQQMLGVYWADLINTEPGQRTAFIRMLASGVLKPFLDQLQMTPERLAALIEDRLRRMTGSSVQGLRYEEYLQFTAGVPSYAEHGEEFETKPTAIAEQLAPKFAHIVRATRLREVRALSGFTRIHPPATTPDGTAAKKAAISRKRLDWLPAIEVRGEGIFLGFDEESVSTWEKKVEGRAAEIDSAYQRDWKQRRGEDDKPERRITARFLLVHAFAHALMRQITLECGYSSAALRERLYVDDGREPMAGVLIYTATSDADGTLGGLERQALPTRIEATVKAAIRAMEWCSSDPLCIHGMLSPPETLNRAACHACLLAPETACEEFNRLLDRAVLVGLPGEPDLGFFSDLLRAT